jgi:hypothetical protein
MSQVFMVSLRPGEEDDNGIDTAVVGVFDSFEKAERAAKVIAKMHSDLGEECLKDMQENEGKNLEAIWTRNNAGLLLSYTGVGVHEIELNSLDANFFPDEDALNQLVKSLE